MKFDSCSASHPYRCAVGRFRRNRRGIQLIAPLIWYGKMKKTELLKGNIERKANNLQEPNP